MNQRRLAASVLLFWITLLVAAACGRIKCLLRAIDCPLSLREVGLADDEALQRMVSHVNPERLSNNPRKTTPEALHVILREATFAPEARSDGTKRTS